MLSNLPFLQKTGQVNYINIIQPLFKRNSINHILYQSIETSHILIYN